MTAIMKDRRKTIHLSVVLVVVIFLNLLVFLTYANILLAACMEGNCDYGQGTYTHPNGSKYVGEFKDGKINCQEAHGKRTEPSSDGERL